MGCSSAPVDTSPQDAGPPARFIAQERDFQGMFTWEAVDVTPASDGHPLDGGRTVYVHQRPADRATAYPTGAILAKVTHVGATPQAWVIHAMAKRGEGFNTDGAVGWEWFELVLDDQERPMVAWRGTHPPSGHDYGTVRDGGVVMDCNGCHAAGGRDGIMTPSLWPPGLR